MRHATKTKQKVIQRRKEGASIPQLAKEFGVAKSSVSLWVRDVTLSEKDKRLLILHTREGLARSHEARTIQKAVWLSKKQDESNRIVETVFLNHERDVWKITAALLFWCEGGKGLNSGIQFMNSDPNMIATFLHALRSGFEIDETKLRALIHLHTYHDRVRQTKFWIQITGIPIERFQGPYIKPNTKKRTREGYPGCISIRYYDKRLAQTLKTLYDAVWKMTKGLGEGVSRRSPKA